MKRILIISNPQSPGTDYYRTVGPLTQLARDYPDEVQVRAVTPDACAWFDIYASDVVVFQRPNGSQILSYIEEARRMGKRIILDIDDLLHGIPEANPATGHFNRPEILQTIEKALSHADHLFVSTPALKVHYANLIDQEKITIARNGWNTEEHPPCEVVPQRDPIRIIWRGSITHLSDLHTVKGTLREIADDPAFAFVMVGVERWALHDLPKSINVVKWQTLFTYFDLMKQSAPDYGIFPLVQDEFNLSKSNIFALECLRAGALPIVPMDFPEWDIPGILRYKDETELRVLIGQIRGGKVDKVGLIEKARAFVFEHLMTRKQNEKRLEVIRSL